tara:strand:- start:112 stop:1017 length:906 start_codon:yes stop_codon:yes gene_type:complete
MKINTIERVSRYVESEEKTQSSHWKKYHSNFKYNNGKLYGLEGFGTINPPFRGLKKIVYNALLTRYYKHIHDKSFFKNIKSKAIEITRKQNRAFDLDVFRQCLTIDFLLYHNVIEKSKTVIVIGDGWGIMTTLLLKLNLANRVILVNLNKTLLVDLIYTELVLPEIVNNSFLIENKEDISKIKKEKLLTIRADKYELLSYLEKDVVINIASFQEMDIEVINNYLKYLEYGEKPFHLYHCNREEKLLPDGSIIKIEDFKFNSNKKSIVSEECSWHKDFISKRPPFILKYDGKTIHQLLQLNL